ncbi:uncharacterized protein LOC136767513 [Amia ocellicauda]|uniref:uncharacterized protein LOC136767513 n=1 Tax=Amia ocellicauda TaxID=2972642 RepID=UPI00346498FC
MHHFVCGVSLFCQWGVVALSLSLAGSSSLSVRAGDSVTLFCNGSDTDLVLWQTPDHHVCHFNFGKCLPAAAYVDRLESIGALKTGNFSVTIHNIQPSDEGLYECSTDEQAGQSTLLGGVHVIVFSREETTSVSYGEPLRLRLYSREAVTVQFNPAGARASLPVCAVEGGTVTPDPAYRTRVSMREQEVTLSALTFTDQGSYTVLDSYTQLPISTMTISVRAHTENLTLQAGAPLSLPLHSRAAVEVLFAPVAGGASISVWRGVERGAVNHLGPGYEHRVSVRDGSLTLPSLTAADQGQYTVRESGTNQTIGTVSVSVADRPQDQTAIAVSVALALVLVLGLGLAARVMWRKWKESGANERGTPGPSEQQDVELGRLTEKLTDTAQPLLKKEESPENSQCP